VPLEPLPPTGKETGSDVGLTVLLVTADSPAVETPGTSARRNKH
jgi:hypothetical protein